MRIGFNARYFYDPGLRGFNRYSFALLRALQNIPDVETHLFSEERYPVHELYRSALRAQVTNLAASRTLLWEQWRLPRHLKKLNLDVFHAPAEGGLPLQKVCPYVLTYHGVPDRSLASLVRSGELTGKLDTYFDSHTNNRTYVSAVFHRLRARVFSHLYLRAADLVITVSNFSKRELVHFMGVPPEKVRVIYEAADDSFVQPLPSEYLQQVLQKYQIPPRFVLFVGGFDKRKNVSTLLTVFARLSAEEPDVALVLVGIGGDIQGSREQSSSLGLREGRSVFFLQRITDRELAALYRSASLFTTLSWHEGFCLPIVEAMTCGTPVLASCFGAIAEVLGDGGWLVDPRRPQDVVERMKTILSQSAVRDELRARALSRSKWFSWQKTALQTWGAYKQLCQGDQSAATYS